MKNRPKLFSIFLLFFSLAVFHGRVSFAAPIDDLKNSIAERQNQIKQIEQEIAAYQAQIESAENQVNTLKNEIQKRDVSIKQLAAKITLTQSKINTSQLILKRLALEINRSTSDIDSRKTALAEIIRTLRETDGESLLEILVRKSEFSEFFTDVERIENLQASVRENLDRLKGLKDNLESNKREEESTKADLQNYFSELKVEQSIEVSTRKAKDQLLRDTKNKESEYQKLVSTRRNKRAEIEQEISKIEDQLKLLIDPSSLPGARSGVLAWPVQNPIITQSFGLTAFALSSVGDVYGNSGHNGIDLKASVGTPILASESGTIKSEGNSDLVCPGGSYGKWILIEHPNHLATLYAHLSFQSIPQGASVNRGQLIGYSGNTGYTTGPHLHFTVYDARTVEMRKSRVCGVLPYGGYLDPKIYL